MSDFWLSSQFWFGVVVGAALFSFPHYWLIGRSIVDLVIWMKKATDILNRQ